MKKTDRKNNTNQVVNWPSNKTYFTVKSLNTLNTNFKEITLRVRIKNALEKKEIVDIGTLNNKSGRPQIAFAMAPVTAEAIKAAKEDDVCIKDVYDTVKIVDIKHSENKNEQPVEQANQVTSSGKEAVNA